MHIYRSLLAAAKDLAPVMRGPVSVRTEGYDGGQLGFTWGTNLHRIHDMGRWDCCKNFPREVQSNA